MINILRTLIRDVKDGAAQKEDIVKYVANNYTVNQIIESFVEMVMDSDINRQPISVSAEEFNLITSLFRVRGIRIGDDGKIQNERRGRPRKDLFLLKIIKRINSSFFLFDGKYSSPLFTFSVLQGKVNPTRNSISIRLFVD